MASLAPVIYQKGIFVFPSFSPRVLAAFSSRDFDASRDLPFFLKSLGLPSGRFFTPHQIHGDEIALASGPGTEAGTDADGVMTEEKNLTLLIRTADCVPVFLFDPDRPAVGLVHAGWRGAQKKIISRAIEKFRQAFGAEPSRLQAALGPSIRKSCYEVGEEFFDFFPDWVEKRNGKSWFDLAGFVKHELNRAGIPEHSIIDSNLCTACSTDWFFSARREGQNTGRFLSAIMLK